MVIFIIGIKDIELIAKRIRIIINKENVKFKMK